MSKKRRSDPDNSSVPPKKVSVSQDAPFLWEEHCFMCGGKANSKKKKTLLNVSKSFSIEKCLQSLEITQNKIVFRRLGKVSDLVQLKAKYHKPCYLKLMNDSNAIQNRTKLTENEKSSYVSTHAKVAVLVVDEYADDL
ncbi:hypothetical protein QAD02_014021 [Eretmocerus hayati]|uniref:Uncharacterized protein n=1 Tax=Eretmocerus hayati TaxID=131215 RepID=A0ACC2P3R0_9HYME|nr:hypothetical protein QAD02_014021 [Eretmocerus hayati]